MPSHSLVVHTCDAAELQTERSLPYEEPSNMVRWPWELLLLQEYSAVRGQSIRGTSPFADGDCEAADLLKDCRGLQRWGAIARNS